MDYGKIYISTKNWQTGTDIVDYNDGTAYFNLFGEKCRCNLYERVVYHEVNGKWQPYKRAEDVVDIRTPEISIKGGK